MLMFFQKKEKEELTIKRLQSGNRGLTKAIKQQEVENNTPGALDLYSDPEMEKFFTKGIRGGQSFISQRYAVGQSDPKLPGTHLLYIDGKYTYAYYDSKCINYHNCISIFQLIICMGAWKH